MTGHCSVTSTSTDAAAPTLAQLAGVSPDAVALDETGDDGGGIARRAGRRRRSVTWGELEARSNAVGHGLLSLGCRPGSHVLLVAGNRVEFFECLLGAWRAGMVYTPAKTGLTPPELDHLLTDADTAVVVTDRPVAREAAARRGLPVVDLDDGLEAWLARQSTEPHPATACGWKMSYTSGTTGRPRGVIPPGAGSTPFPDAFRGTGGWAKLAQLPGVGAHLFVSGVFHGAPLTFGLGALARGATLRVLARWSAADALAALADPDVTSTIMVPTMFRQLLAAPGVDLTRSPAPGMVTLFHGGEPCPVRLKRTMLDWFGPVLVEYYGFTEGGVTFIDSTEWLARPGSVGRPTAALTVTVRNEDGKPLPPRTEGTLYFSGPTHAAEPASGTGQTQAGQTQVHARRFRYRNNPGRTTDAFLGDAFTVGDVGWLDEEGYVYISGRRTDVVVSAGVNVYPAEVEDALADAPGVADLCAVGGPDAERGEAVVLFVALAPGAVESEVLAALDTQAEQRLARYKRPARVVVVDAVPRDATGKIVRVGLRAQLWEAAAKNGTVHHGASGFATPSPPAGVVGRPDGSQ